LKHPRLSLSVVASTMMSYPNRTDSCSIAGFDEDFKISPSMFDEGDYGKCDYYDGFEVMKELSDAWLANDDPDDLLCSSSIDDLILDGDRKEAFDCSTTERVRSTSFDDLELGDGSMESWASEFGLSLE
jgi:hypothetical protein